MGFTVRAIRLGHFRCANQNMGYERKYPGDEFDVEEHEFSDGHRQPVKNRVVHNGWMEKVSDYPEPSKECKANMESADQGLKPREPLTLKDSVVVPKSHEVPPPAIDTTVKRRPGRPRKNEASVGAEVRIRSAAEVLADK